jgi:hypothetical protein
MGIPRSVALRLSSVCRLVKNNHLEITQYHEHRFPFPKKLIVLHKSIGAKGLKSTLIKTVENIKV